jgi:adenylate cyclase, class 2
MKHLNIEIKARCTTIAAIEQLLIDNHAEQRGTDHQIDTYFKVPAGRLKLREGNIENALIHYEREDKSGPKQSDILLYEVTENSSVLKAILTKTLGVLTVVDKKRQIFFIKNVKFHLDNVQNLGTFVEIEAIDSTGTVTAAALKAQCDYYLALFGIKEADLLSHSYSDML